MTLFDLLKQAQGGRGLDGLARQFGMDTQTAESLAGMLAPAIGSAARRRAEANGLEAVMGQFRGEAQAEYFDHPETAAAPEAQAQGQQFLENVLGSREAGDGIAEEAANRLGVDPSLVMQFLPAIAAMVLGGMQRNVPDNQIDDVLSGFGGGGPGGGLMGALGGMLGGAQRGSGGNSTLDMLNGMFDADGDGSALDDVLERFMKG